MGFLIYLKRRTKKKVKKYKLGLHKTREGALAGLHQILSKSSKIDDELFDELEEVFYHGRYWRRYCS